MLSIYYTLKAGILEALWCKTSGHSPLFEDNNPILLAIFITEYVSICVVRLNWKDVTAT